MEQPPAQKRSLATKGQSRESLRYYLLEEYANRSQYVLYPQPLISLARMVRNQRQEVPS